MPDVFVSYKREDQPRVAPIVSALESAGLSVWWDGHIPGGENWRSAIRENLGAARCVLVLWSEASVGHAGEFVHEEAGVAKGRGILLPVRIDVVQPPLGFGQVQTLDLLEWTGDARDARFQDILNAARALVAGQPRPVPKPKAFRLRRAGVIGGGMATLALVLSVSVNARSLLPALCHVPGVGSMWKAPADTTYKRGVQVLPLTVRPTLKGLPTEQAARADARTRARDEAKSLCKSFEHAGTRLFASVDSASSWRCSARDGGTACGFDGEALCTLDVPVVTVGAGCP